MVRQRRPLGIQGDVRREGIGRTVRIGGARAVGSRVPAAERVAQACEGVSVNAVGTLAIWLLIEPVPPLLLKVTMWSGRTVTA